MLLPHHHHSLKSLLKLLILCPMRCYCSIRPSSTNLLIKSNYELFSIPQSVRHHYVFSSLKLGHFSFLIDQVCEHPYAFHHLGTNWHLYISLFLQITDLFLVCLSLILQVNKMQPFRLKLWIKAIVRSFEFIELKLKLREIFWLKFASHYRLGRAASLNCLLTKYNFIL